MESIINEFKIAYIGVIPNENFSGLDSFGRTDFLRIYDRAKKNKIIACETSTSINFNDYILQIMSNKIKIIENNSKMRVFEVSIPLILCCSSLTEDNITLFVFSIEPHFQQNQNYRDFLVIALPNENQALILANVLNEKFSKAAEYQLENASRHPLSLSTSLVASSPLAPLDTPLTESSHQSSVVSKAINEVLICLRPEEVPHFREILRRYHSGEQNVKVFAQKLVELLGAGRKKRLSYLKYVLKSEDVGQFDSAIIEN